MRIATLPDIVTQPLPMQPFGIVGQKHGNLKAVLGLQGMKQHFGLGELAFGIFFKVSKALIQILRKHRRIRQSPRIHPEIPWIGGIAAWTNHHKNQWMHRLFA